MLPGFGEFPIAVEVPVPVQPAGETAAHERLGVGVEVPLGEPWGKPVGDVAFEETGPVLAGINLGEVDISGSEPEDFAHGGDRVGVEFFFGFAGFLEVEDVVESVSGVGFEHIDEAEFDWGHVGDGHGGDAVEEVGSELGERPGDHGPPVVADDGGGASSVVADEPGDVSGEVEDVIVGDVFRGVARGVSAHVRGDDLVPCFGDCGDLVAPRV